jgi:hypothetical protein
MEAASDIWQYRLNQQKPLDETRRLQSLLESQRLARVAPVELSASIFILSANQKL